MSVDVDLMKSLAAEVQRECPELLLEYEPRTNCIRIYGDSLMRDLSETRLYLTLNPDRVVLAFDASHNANHRSYRSVLGTTNELNDPNTDLVKEVAIIVRDALLHDDM